MFVQDILDKELFWEEEIMRVGVDRLFGCFTPLLSHVVGVDDSAPARAPSTSGLVSGHAYSIIKAVEFKGRKFLRCVCVSAVAPITISSHLSPDNPYLDTSQDP